ncbi:H-NS histone family protein [uncultured Hydrogenophaga sp.]|uniref:H-NS histone family protein n=1 Tax=uncultured Hydrogenophaga sp. TaxID=199683 RepID=UPI00265FF6E4|nr:H-NS histone family protein [uncultured Hydrogenophaga sp.]
MSTAPDVSKLSYSELQLLVAEAQERLAAKREEEIKVLADAYAKKVVAAGFSVQEAIDALKPYLPKRGAGGKKADVKYRDPANPDNTWSGKGKRPAWIHQYVAAGRALEEFLVS